MLQCIKLSKRQVRDGNLENSSDTVIWNFAKEGEYCIVTFDSDFYDLSLVKGFPPKIIWLRTGNTSTKNIEKLLRENQLLIQEFIDNKDYTEISCLEIG